MLPSPSLFAYARLVYDQTGSLARGFRFFIRSHLRRDVTVSWLRFIESSPVLSSAPARVKSVLCDKIHRPFARRAFGPRERADFLINHYKVVEQVFDKNALSSLVAGERALLATLRSGKGELFRFTLGREMISQHQGELTFLMIDEAQGLSLARLMVNMALDEKGRRLLVLNGIQGPGPEYKDRIVRATRNLSGLRPKRAVLEAAYAFASWIGADGVRATAKTNHVSQSKAKWQRKIHADYDDFWREFDPRPLPDGDFEMPLAPPVRSLEDVPPKKRKLWLARQALLASLAEQTTQALKGLSS